MRFLLMVPSLLEQSFDIMNQCDMIEMNSYYQFFSKDYVGK